MESRTAAVRLTMHAATFYCEWRFALSLEDPRSNRRTAPRTGKGPDSESEELAHAPEGTTRSDARAARSARGCGTARRDPLAADRGSAATSVGARRFALPQRPLVVDPCGVIHREAAESAFWHCEGRLYDAHWTCESVPRVRMRLHGFALPRGPVGQDLRVRRTASRPMPSSTRAAGSGTERSAANPPMPKLASMSTRPTRLEAALPF